MTDLTQMKNGQRGRIVWMIGKLGEQLRKFCGIQEDDILMVLRHMPDGSAIVRCNGKRYAMDADTAFKIKVNRLSA
ncbi:MAG: FeoA family protein [Anaerovoracaceae bacterium]|nr:FeoA family protein [Bacillota bacterium]MDY2670447.1 FeoA family protein [Anaerovoracaceae bacterium]